MTHYQRRLQVTEVRKVRCCWSPSLMVEAMMFNTRPNETDAWTKESLAGVSFPSA